MGMFRRAAQGLINVAWHAAHGRAPGGTRRAFVGSGLPKRGFDAGEESHLTYSWTRVPLTADETVRRNLRILRARSRDMAERGDHAKRFLRMVQSHVVGPTGFTLQARVRDPDGKQDTLANDAIEAAWQDWCKPQHCDVAGELSMAAQDRLAIRTMAVDGETLIRKVRGKIAGKYRFALQHIDPELLDVNYNDDLRNGHIIRMGIEFDGWRRRVAYHLIDQGDQTYWYNGQRYLRIPAEEIYHLFLPERVGQKRGLPWLSTPLLRMQMLSGYETAAVVAARQGANQLGWWKTPTGEGYTGDGVDADGNIIDEAEPGHFGQVAEGSELIKWDPTYPHGDYGDSVKWFLRGISSGLDVSYPTLANDLEGVNFSSLRHGALEEREVWKLLQSWMIEHFKQQLYEDWLKEALLTPGIPVGRGRLALERIDKYRSVHIQGRRWSWVDPLKEMQANEKELAERLTSRSALIRERGGDPEEVWREIQRENELLKTMGLTPAPKTPPAPPGAAKETKDDDDDED